MPIISDTQHRNLTFWGMALIAIGLPLSGFLISIGTFVLAGNWLLERDYKQRLKRFFTDPLSLIIVSIYLLFVVGMIHTENVDQGLKELRIKLPILLLPLFLFTSKLPSKKRLQDILLLFVMACVIGTGVSMIRYFGIADDEIVNRRHLSVFISHIRFGLMVVLSFFILTYYLIAKQKHWSIVDKILTLGIMGWLFYFLILLESPSSYLGFVAVLCFSLLRLIFTLNKLWLKIITVLIILVGSSFSFLYVNAIYQNHLLDLPFERQKLDLKTANGRYYSHEPAILKRENGHRTWNYVCWQELYNEWPKQSQIPLNGKDKHGNEVKYTLIRYLASKGFRKDSIGLNKLSSIDIRHIENGFTNYKYADNWGVSRKINQLFWEMNEYETKGDPNVSSLMQRVVYFRSGLQIVGKHFLFGVGTGDLYAEFQLLYSKNDNGLIEKRKGISHNQFLSIAIGVGVIGFAWFVFALFFPLREYWKDYLYTTFLLLIVVSLLSDNTLDSQAGATFFAFFNALLMVRKEFEAV
ncbi:MAG: O-antigen ligase family protein [Flavobacteriales bacterium]|nr:O-antigen ligase family protein [Flavobacteriales bacterium]